MAETRSDAVESSGTTRRAVLLGAGAAGAAGVLAACGGEEPGGTPAANPPGGATTRGGAPTTAASAIKVAEIPVGSGKIYGNRSLVVTQPTTGDFKAFDTTCPHQGCQVSEIGGGLITCGCHGSQFRIADGSVARGPNTGQPLSRGLTPLSATVDGDTITVG
jgi:nitrite reductase/ring-hydroxylating ferredoxin subunit